MRHDIGCGGTLPHLVPSDRSPDHRATGHAAAPPPAPAGGDWATPEDARRRCTAFAGAQRFPYFRLALSVAATPQHPLQNVEITNFPEPWLEHYRRCGYAHLDPTLARLRTTLAPFAWRELDRRSDGTQTFFAEAAAHGLVDGLTVPLRGGNGEAVILTLAGRPVPASAPARMRLYEAAYTFLYTAFEPLRGLFARESGEQATEALTDRQRQIMILLMQGFGVKSIARALNIHSRTVDDGLRRACARLRARSREQAIVRALELRQVDLSACAPSSPFAHRAPPR